MTYVEAGQTQLRRPGQIKLHGARGVRGHAQGRALDRRGARPARPLVQARRHHRRARQAVFDFAIDHGAYPAPLNYRGYRKSICTSINHVVCHGIPDDKPLREGDIVNIDVTLIVDGWHGDSSRMYAAGEPSATRAAADRRHLRIADARHRARSSPARRPATSATRSRPTPRASAAPSCATSAATASAGCSTTSPTSCISAGAAKACR